MLIEVEPQEISLPLRTPYLEQMTIDATPSSNHSDARSIAKSEIESKMESDSTTRLQSSDTNASNQTASVESGDNDSSVSKESLSSRGATSVHIPLSNPNSAIPKSVQHRATPSHSKPGNPIENSIPAILESACKEQNQFGGNQNTQIAARMEWENGIIKRLCDLLAVPRPDGKALNNKKGREQLLMSLARLLRERLGSKVELPKFIDR